MGEGAPMVGRGGFAEIRGGKEMHGGFFVTLKVFPVKILGVYRKPFVPNVEKPQPDK